VVAAVVTDPGRGDTVTGVTSDTVIAEVVTPLVMEVSAADTDDDAVADVTVMLTRESTGVAVVVAAAAVVVLRVALNVDRSWRALLSSYAHVSRANSMTERLLSGNSSISLFLTDTDTCRYINTLAQSNTSTDVRLLSQKRDDNIPM